MLQGKKVCLRTVRESDLDLIYRLMTDVSQKGEYWLIDIPAEPAFRRGFIERGFWHDNFGRLLIVDRQAGRVVGEIIYFRNADYRAGYEIGYQIFRREDRGKGYMSEALTLFSAFLFESKPIPRLQLTLVVGNESSRKVAEKCGYHYEGTLRKAAFLAGKYVDLELFGLLREECPPLRL
ncbi:GNAT family N-acetyltransferase [Sporomusa acidovorans]|uniref:N-acetyltransferase domain-containing protein n=1 Tax=Sporomusa acidovorans (strain ATCC 49682 / DSM 3132 / Mol) TaxID=1123286 RepID=A0ABZ3IWP7_SPOA4|nr:GNAT family protein [Sporomusa acidovorans]OZC17980.1 putative ribosomal N-acetyltransferase YdaF [Sporomusa acidovorans DSM 3132]SDF42008.1 Protein N-acetyltransferase, RimJ/RimL family [Sporomusa acidovorans]